MDKLIVLYYRSLLIVILGLASAQNAFTQGFFEKHYLFGSDQSAARAICRSTTGAFFVVCENQHFYYPFLCKLNDSGKVIWAKRSGYISSSESQNYAANKPVIIATHDGGFALAATNSNIRASLIKYDSNGTLQWAKTISRDNDAAASVVETSDNGFVLVNCIPNATYSIISKTDSIGNILWSKKIFLDGSNKGVIPGSVVELSDRSIVIAGANGNLNGMGIAKLAADGTIKWLKFGTDQGKIFSSNCIATSDGGFLFSAECQTTDTYLMVTKANSDGVIQWSRKITHGAPVSDPCAVELPSGSFIVAGNHFRAGSDNARYYDSIVILRMNSTGDVIKNSTFSVGSLSIATAWGVAVNTAQSVFLCGSISTGDFVAFDDAFVMNIDTDFLNCSFAPGLVVASSFGSLNEMAFGETSPELVGGVVALSSQPSIQSDEFDICLESKVETAGHSIVEFPTSFPNPTSRSVYIPFYQEYPGRYRAIVRSVAGQTIHTYEIDGLSGKKTIEVTIADLSAGIYNIEILDANSFTCLWRGKIVKE